MDFEYSENKGQTICIGYDDDICIKCLPEVREKCPLLLGISNHIVYPAAGSITITDCGLLQYINERK